LPDGRDIERLVLAGAACVRRAPEREAERERDGARRASNAAHRDQRVTRSL
jgi:hypothetical protein